MKSVCALSTASVLTLFLISCGGGSSSSNGNQVTNSILGQWELMHPDVQCLEVYTYLADGSFTIQSLDEIQTGTYEFQESVDEGSRHRLTMTITMDNGLSSCTGDTSDDTGLSGTLYTEFVDENRVSWYDNNSGGSAQISLNRAD